MNDPSPKRHPGKSGFNLVEISIAMVVVAIGILSIAAVFPSQLETVRDGMDRTNMGLFAQQVHESALAMASDSNVAQIANGIPLLTTGGTYWYTGTDTGVGSSQETKVQADGAIHYIYQVDSTNTSADQYALGYRLRVTPIQGQGLTYQVKLELWPRVWPGHGSDPGPPETFVTEVYYSGGI